MLSFGLGSSFLVTITTVCHQTADRLLRQKSQDKTTVLPVATLGSHLDGRYLSKPPNSHKSNSPEGFLLDINHKAKTIRLTREEFIPFCLGPEIHTQKYDLLAEKAFQLFFLFLRSDSLTEGNEFRMLTHSLRLSRNTPF